MAANGRMPPLTRTLLVLGFVVALGLFVVGGYIWRVHFSDDQYWIGMAIEAIAVALLWAVASRVKAARRNVLMADTRHHDG